MYMGIDIGTSGVKTAIIDKAGTIRSLGYCGFKMHGLSERKRELDPFEVIAGVEQAVREAVSRANGKAVGSIIISSLGEAVVAVDKDNKPLMNSILGSDSRGEKEIEWLYNYMDEVLIASITGLNKSNIYSLNKILYIKKYMPDIFKKTKKFLLFTDFLVNYFTGEYIIDYSMASRTLMFDINSHTWSKDIMDLVELDESVFSKPAIAGTVAGKLRGEIADRLGLSANADVLIGCHDHICNAIGCGAIEAGYCANTVGTTEGITAVIGGTKLTSNVIIEKNMSCEPFAVKGIYNTVAWHNTAGALVKWYIRTFEDPNVDVTDLLIKLGDMDCAPGSVMALPHFSGATVQVMDGSAKGALAGLTLSTRKEDIFKGLIEGGCYETAIILEAVESSGIKMSKIITTGGCSKSKLWKKVKADVLGRPICTVVSDATGVLGGAVIASVVKGDYANMRESVSNMVKFDETIEPNIKNHAVHKERLFEYKKLYGKLRSVNQLL